MDQSTSQPGRAGQLAAAAQQQMVHLRGNMPPGMNSIRSLYSVFVIRDMPRLRNTPIPVLSYSRFPRRCPCGVGYNL